MRRHLLLLALLLAAPLSAQETRLRTGAASVLVLEGSSNVTDWRCRGTTLEGRALPKGYSDEGGTKRENGVETPLPARATLRLADLVTVEFDATGT